MKNPTTVILNLSKHCIETTAKNELKRLSDEYLTEQVEESSIKKMELLLNFLENSNFQNLRSSSDNLSGEIKSTVELYYDSTGNVQLKIL